jgi:glucokinase
VEIDIAADIGGTYARFATHAHGRIRHISIRKVSAYPGSFVDALKQYRTEFCSRHTVKMAVVAVPTAVMPRGTQLEARRGAWVFNRTQIAETLGIKPQKVSLINDLQAAAYAVLGLNPQRDFKVVKEGTPALDAPVLILSIGTGFGIGRLTSHRQNAKALPSEGSTALMALPEREDGLTDAIRKVKKDATLRDLLSCRLGIGTFYAANLVLNGAAHPQNLPPPEIIVARAREGDLLCRQTLTDFSWALGVCASGKAVDPVSLGGIYLMGVQQKLGSCFDASAFLKGMDMGTQRCEDVVRRIPVKLIKREIPAFDGIKFLLRRRPTRQRLASPANGD